MSKGHPKRRNSVVQTLKKALVCTWNEAEAWQKENPHLLGSYRTPSYSYRQSFASLGYLHNQTSNIYTHLIGAVLFLSWAVETYNEVLQRYPTSDFYDFLAFGVFFGCALLCFGSSALFHMFANHSVAVNHTWLLFDLYGVFALIVATIFSGTFYAFYCEREWWIIYSGGIMLISCMCAAVCSKSAHNQTKSWRNMRTALFVAIGFYGCIPMTHLAQTRGRQKADSMMGWNFMFWEGISYFVGAAIYGVRIPERWRPGKFDIWGASHQIFHICAVVGAALHYRGLIQGFDHSHNPVSRQC